MDTRTVDRGAPICYAAILVLSALFFPVALAPIAIFGALALALYYVALRPRLAELDTARRSRRAEVDGAADRSDDAGG